MYNVNEEDAGVYVCVATNSNGRTSTEAQVNVIPIWNQQTGDQRSNEARISISPQDATLGAGDQIRLLCEIISPSGDEGYTIEWSRLVFLCAPSYFLSISC